MVTQKCQALLIHGRFAVLKLATCIHTGKWKAVNTWKCIAVRLQHAQWMCKSEKKRERKKICILYTYNNCYLSGYHSEVVYCTVYKIQYIMLLKLRWLVQTIKWSVSIEKKINLLWNENFFSDADCQVCWNRSGKWKRGAKNEPSLNFNNNIHLLAKNWSRKVPMRQIIQNNREVLNDSAQKNHQPKKREFN